MFINNKQAWLREITEKIAHTPAEKIFLTCIGIDAALFLTLLIALFFNFSWENHFWPPPEMPRSSLTYTAFNSLFLGMSIVTLFQAFRFLYIPTKRFLIFQWLRWTILTGSLFFFHQSLEWVNMLAFALHTPLNLLMAFFYPLIFLYALHLFAGLTALILVMRQLKQNTWMLQPASQARVILGQTHLALVGAYWTAIALLWPILYYVFYL